MKIVYISNELHKKLRLRAIHNNSTLQNTTDDLLIKALKH